MVILPGSITWIKNHGKKPTQQTLAGEFGKSRPWITKHLEIAKLNNEVKENLLFNNISWIITTQYLLPLSDTQKQILSGEK